MKFTFTCLFFFLFILQSSAQTCTTLGQNPQTAFPVCGTSVFGQSNVPICGERPVQSPCGGSLFTDKNPFWYKFTCFSSGTLGFVINPLIAAEDYDWQLFDVTGKNPASVYTDPSTFVASNWSAEFGATGASSAGNTLILCDGPGVPLFTAMPNLIQGHSYLLLVSHFTDTQSGYTLSFGSGTAVITDPTQPHLDSASAFCDGTVINIRLNKKMNCRTLAANGSDFEITPAIATVINASGVGCSGSFDMEAVTLTLSNPLPPGNYTISIKNGDDGNTLLDICDRSIAAGENVPVTVSPVLPTPMDSLVTPRCSPDKLELVFNKKIRCNSIAANGSDFIVTGSYPVSIVSATGDCENGLTNRITVQLSSPLQRAGSFNIRFNPASPDGNTIIDECGAETPLGSGLNFTVKDTVSAAFSFTTSLGCELDTINYFHNGANGVNSWKWVFDTDRLSDIHNPEIYYSTPGDKITTLTVSNGFCRDSSTRIITLDPRIKAGFEATTLICPLDPATFRDTSIGNIVRWQWNFGNGNTSSLRQPPAQHYPQPQSPTQQIVSLTVFDAAGCSSTSQVPILLIDNCFIAVPSAFTPNGDGLNDFLYPLNAYKAVGLRFAVYNRVGNRVFYTEDWTRKWDGRFKGQAADMGTYVWTLNYFDPESNKVISQKGSVILIR